MCVSVNKMLYLKSKSCAINRYALNKSFLKSNNKSPLNHCFSLFS